MVTFKYNICSSRIFSLFLLISGIPIFLIYFPVSLKINLENITDGDTIAYPLVLIKGTAITNETHVTVNGAKFEIRDGKFRCLLELRENEENAIEFDRGPSIRLRHAIGTNDRKVQPLYIICEGHDGNFEAPLGEPNGRTSAAERIDTSCRMLQTILAEKLYEAEFGRKTFVLEPCRIFESRLDFESARKMKQDELWTYFGREIMGSNLACDRTKFVGFLSCTNYRRDKYTQDLDTHEDLLKITEAYVALGGGGLALFGTACLYTWPKNCSEILDCFKDGTRIDRSLFLDDSAYRGTKGACFSTTLGSVLHELCHTFDLGHTAIGIMGRGFDDLQNIFLPHNHNGKAANVETPKDTNDVISFKIKDRDSNSFIRSAKFSNETINKTVCIDDTCFTKSSAFILGYHKWFNNFPNDKKFVLSYDRTVRLVKSTLGIRVVEVRRAADEMVVASWCFGGKILKHNFQIDEECAAGFGLFVEDNNGNVLKLPNA